MCIKITLTSAPVMHDLTAWPVDWHSMQGPHDTSSLMPFLKDQTIVDLAPKSRRPKTVLCSREDLTPYSQHLTPASECHRPYTPSNKLGFSSNSPSASPKIENLHLPMKLPQNASYHFLQMNRPTPSAHPILHPCICYLPQHFLCPL